MHTMLGRELRNSVIKRQLGGSFGSNSVGFLPEDVQELSLIRLGASFELGDKSTLLM